MKVSQLEKGMLLRPISGDMCFSAYQSLQYDLRWIHVRKRTRIMSQPTRWSRPVAVDPAWALDAACVMYLGTKKDLGISDLPWVNRFVMHAGEIFAVDPAVWKKLEPLEENV